MNEPKLETMKDRKSGDVWCVTVRDPSTIGPIDPWAAWCRLSRRERAAILLRNSVVPLCIYALQFVCLVVMLLCLRVMLER